MSFRHLDNLKSGKYGETGEGGVLVMQEITKDSDTAKVDANVKADAPDDSNVFNGSKIDTPKINVKRGIEKPCAAEIVLYWRMSLR